MNDPDNDPEYANMLNMDRLGKMLDAMSANDPARLRQSLLGMKDIEVNFGMDAIRQEITRTPLRLDAAPLLEIFLEHGVMEQKRVDTMESAIKANRLDLVEQLLKSGVALEGALYAERWPSCPSALMRAAEVSDEAMVKLLLAHGAAVDTRDDAGQTALFHACGNGTSARVVEMLLEAGADPNIQDENQHCALHMLALSPINDARDGVPLSQASALVRFGADMELANSSGTTPRQMLVREKRQAWVYQLDAIIDAHDLQQTTQSTPNAKPHPRL